MQPAACPPNLPCTSELTAAGMWALMAETVERRGAGCWDPSTMTTFKMSHTRVRCKDNNAAICIRVSTPTQTFNPTLFSVRNARNLAWPFDCKKRRAPFLKKQRGILGVGSDGQESFLFDAFSPSVFSHERRQCEKLGCCSDGTTCVGSPSIWLIIRTLCATEMKKDRELIAMERKRVQLN